MTLVMECRLTTVRVRITLLTSRLDVLQFSQRDCIKLIALAEYRLDIIKQNRDVDFYSCIGN